MLEMDSGNGIKLSEYAREYVADPVAARVRSRELRIAEETKLGGRGALIHSVRSKLNRKTNKLHFAG